MQDQNIIRFSIFIAVLALMLLLEQLRPRRQRLEKRRLRWSTNLGLAFINGALVAVCIPVAAMGMASIADDYQWGILNVLGLPEWLNIIVAIALLDMLIYWQHVASHKLPFLWSFHKAHHADRDIDTTTGVRFHPIEILLSAAFKLFCVIVLGVPVLAVFLFEIWLNACALFNHANLSLPQNLDRRIRRVFVTPDMHRIHHSVEARETNSNYGFSVSLWDRLFGSYTDQPSAGQEHFVIGLSEYQNHQPSKLWWSVLLPVQPHIARGIVKVSIIVAVVFSLGKAALWLDKNRQLDTIHREIATVFTEVDHTSSTQVVGASQDTILFDVREPEEFEVSHIKGAIQLSPNIHPAEFIDRFAEQIEGKRLVFYCSVGRRSSQMVDTLKGELASVAGVKAENLAGGLFKWHNEGLPLVDNTGQGTEVIHPYNSYWSRLIDKKESIRYEP